MHVQKLHVSGTPLVAHGRACGEREESNQQAAIWGTHPTLPGKFKYMNDADHKMTKEDRDNMEMVKYREICWKSQNWNV